MSEEAMKLALEALKEIALAGMSGTGQESEEAMTEWHARQAWKFIAIAARALEPIKQALAEQPAQQEPWPEEPAGHKAGGVQLSGTSKSKAITELYALFGAPHNADINLTGLNRLLDELIASPPAQQEPVRVPVMDNTYNYAKSLAEAIFKQHFSSDEHYACGRIVWGVNDTVIGILTQIDNMVADMVRKPAQCKPLTDVIKAAQGVLEWTEIAHRPPKRDRLEAGRMAMVRLHALADLHDALTAHSIKEQP